MSVQSTSTPNSGRLNIVRPLRLPSPDRYLTSQRDPHNSPTKSINIHWQSSTEQWKSTVSFDPWQPSPLDPVVEQRAPNQTTFGAPHPNHKGASLSLAAKASEVDRYSLSRGSNAAMLEQERSIRAALLGLPYPTHDSNPLFPRKAVQGTQGEKEFPLPIGHGSIWAPKKGEGVTTRSRSPFLCPAELSHLPPKPSDPPPSYVDKPQTQDWPALGESRSTPTAKCPTSSCDTPVPSQAGSRYSEVAADVPGAESKSTDTVRPGKWGQLGRATEAGKSKVISPRPIRVSLGSRRAHSQASIA